MKGSITTARGLILASLLALAIPTLALAQGRGQGRGQEKNTLDRKCAKFVNCHDASDGRRDGKGPRRSSLERSSHRHRNRNFDDNGRRLRRRHARDREVYRKALTRSRR